MVHIQDVQEVRFAPILLLISQEKIMKQVRRHFLRTNAYLVEQDFLSEGGKTHEKTETLFETKRLSLIHISEPTRPTT